jgi:plasmid maintenance system antidote protein VapI
MSQIAMAQALGIPLEHLKRLETDLRPLSAEIQHKIERAFGPSIHHYLPLQ